jgi:hypothetical protein
MASSAGSGAGGRIPSTVLQPGTSRLSTFTLDNVVYHAQHLCCCFIGCGEQRETEVTLLARLVELARGVDADPRALA